MNIGNLFSYLRGKSSSSKLRGNDSEVRTLRNRLKSDMEEDLAVRNKHMSDNTRLTLDAFIPKDLLDIAVKYVHEDMGSKVYCDPKEEKREWNILHVIATAGKEELADFAKKNS